MPTITFKVTIDEARELRSEAKKRRMTLSDFIRTRALAQENGRHQPKLVTCAHTGAKVFAGISRRGQLTGEKVKELLADFP